MPGWHSPGQKSSVCENSAIFEQFLFLDQNRHLCPFSTGPCNCLKLVELIKRLHTQMDYSCFSHAQLHHRDGLYWVEFWMQQNIAQKCWRIDRQNKNMLQKLPRNFELPKLSLECSLQKFEQHELSRELSHGMKQWVSWNFGDLSLQFRCRQNFVEKPGKARNFVEIRLHYFCTVQ